MTSQTLPRHICGAKMGTVCTQQRRHEQVTVRRHLTALTSLYPILVTTTMLPTRRLLGFCPAFVSSAASADRYPMLRQGCQARILVPPSWTCLSPPISRSAKIPHHPRSSARGSVTASHPLQPRLHGLMDPSLSLPDGGFPTSEG